MKKLIVTLLAVSMSLVLFGCSKGNEGGKETEAQIETEASKETDAAVETDADLEKTGVLLTSVGGSYSFMFSSELKLYENAWLGLCPAGKSYTDELDADEDDIFWVYPDNFSGKAADEDYVFKISSEDIAMFEDGKYTMVLCDNDDEGKVILYFPLEKSGAELIPDFDKITVN